MNRAKGRWMGRASMPDVEGNAKYEEAAGKSGNRVCALPLSN
jgi:hypothetical protein